MSERPNSACNDQNSIIAANKVDSEKKTVRAEGRQRFPYDEETIKRRAVGTFTALAVLL